MGIIRDTAFSFVSTATTNSSSNDQRGRRQSQLRMPTIGDQRTDFVSGLVISSLSTYMGQGNELSQGRTMQNAGQTCDCLVCKDVYKVEGEEQPLLNAESISKKTDQQVNPTPWRSVSATIPETPGSTSKGQSRSKSMRGLTGMVERIMTKV